MAVDVEELVEEVVTEVELEDQVARVSSWQWVIHGETRELRKLAVVALLRQKGGQAAKRYALCGRGDEMRTNQRGAFRIIPHGCGERVCPRCSRKRGVKFLRKVEHHLAVEPHGYLYHMVLTQRVLHYEKLVESASRFNAKWKRMRPWLGQQGMTAALATIHINWSRKGGWHYHMHLFLEITSLLARESVEKVWWRLLEEMDHTEKAAPCFLRKLADPGPALSELFESAGQVEFWSEASSEMGTALQYPLRDILAGVTNWSLGEADAKRMEELVRDTQSMQSHRTYGRWRLPVTPAEEEDEDAEVERIREEVNTMGWLSLGIMDQVQVAACVGTSFCVEGLMWLERNVRNESVFGRRVVNFCRVVIPF
ncbi:hypothetical protein ES703_64107 [subsurface metagenome]